MPCISISGSCSFYFTVLAEITVRRTIADEAELGNVVSTEVDWIIAQEELNVCDD